MLCPICKQPSATPSTDGKTSVFPFCSERCKLIDLGRWLDGRYQIPVEPDDETAADVTLDPPATPHDEE